MRAYVLVLMALERCCRSLRPCVALIVAVIGIIIVGLLNTPVLTYYTLIQSRLDDDKRHICAFDTDEFVYVLCVFT